MPLTFTTAPTLLFIFSSLLVAPLWPLFLSASATTTTAEPSTTTAEPTTFFISPFGEDAPGRGTTQRQPFQTLGYALYSTRTSGDLMINVMSGVYRNVRDIVEFNMTKGAITVRAFPLQNMPEKHVFQSPDLTTDHFFRFKRGVTVAFEGVAFVGGKSTNFVYGEYANLTFTNCLFRNNKGGLAINGGNVKVRNSTFMDNGDAVLIYDGEVDVANSRFKNNDNGFNLQYASSIPRITSPVRVTNTSFSGNTANSAAFLVTAASKLLVDGLSASNLGYGFYCKPAYYRQTQTYEIRVSNARFENNHHAIYTDTNADPQYSSKGSIHIVDSRFFNNTAKQFNSGAAIIVAAQLLVAIHNSYFIKNTATFGGAFICQNTATMNIAQSYFIGNTAKDGGNGYCNENCAFLATDVEVQGTNQTQDTHPCPGFPSDRHSFLN